jgi:hypothetical protein
MDDALFHSSGREARNRDAEAFSSAADRLCSELGWDPLQSRIDVRKRTGGDSRGLDGCLVIRNAQSGEGELWIRDEKRHDGPSRYSARFLADEAQSLRDKLAELDRPGLYNDPELGTLFNCVRGGFLLHHTRDWDDARVRRSRAEAANALRAHQLGARPYLIWHLVPMSCAGSPRFSDSGLQKRFGGHRVIAMQHGRRFVPRDRPAEGGCCFGARAARSCGPGKPWSVPMPSPSLGLPSGRASGST